MGPVSASKSRQPEVQKQSVSLEHRPKEEPEMAPKRRKFQERSSEIDGSSKGSSSSNNNNNNDNSKKGQGDERGKKKKKKKRRDREEDEVISPTQVGYEKLHEEILEFAEACGSSKQRKEAAKNLVSRIERCSRLHLEDAKAHLFGSEAVGLSGPTSDFDVVVLSPRIGDPTTSNSAKMDVLNFMYSLAGELSASAFRSVQVIAHAAVPIIKCSHGLKGLAGWSCDISVGVVSGLRAVSMMNGRMSQHAGIRPLVLILKRLLKERGLNEVYTGGLSSFSIFHLVLSFLESGGGCSKAQTGGDWEGGGANKSASGGGGSFFHPATAADRGGGGGGGGKSDGFEFPYFLHGAGAGAGAGAKKKSKDDDGGGGGGGGGGGAGPDSFPVPFFVNGASPKHEVGVEGKHNVTTDATTSDGPASGNSFGSHNLGESLVSLLTLYGGLGSYRCGEHAIHPSKGVVNRLNTRLSYPLGHNRGRQNGDTPRNRFAVIDATEPTNDTAKGCFRTWEVMHAFRSAASVLKGQCTDYKRGSDSGRCILGSVVVYARQILDGDGEHRRRKRQRGDEGREEDDEGERYGFFEVESSAGSGVKHARCGGGDDFRELVGGNGKAAMGRSDAGGRRVEGRNDGISYGGGGGGGGDDDDDDDDDDGDSSSRDDDEDHGGRDSDSSGDLNNKYIFGWDWPGGQWG